MADSISLRSSHSLFIPRALSPEATQSSDRKPVQSRHSVAAAKAFAVSPALHRKVQGAHDVKVTASLMAAAQGHTPLELQRRIGGLATELADLREDLNSLASPPPDAPTTSAVIKRQVELNKRRTTLVNAINLKTFLLEGTAAAREIALGASPDSLSYKHIASVIAGAVDKLGGEEGESVENARNGYARLFEDHPSFRENGVLGQFELAASTHDELSATIKRLQQGGNAEQQADIAFLKLSDQLVKNTVAGLLEEHGGEDSGIDVSRARELVNAIHAGDVVADLQRKHAGKGFLAYARAITLPAGASIAGAALHYGTCRTGTEELIKTRSSLDPENSYRDAALMALASGLVLGLTYFLFNRTVGPLTKAALEKIPGLAPRPLKVTSAEEVIPTVAHTAIKDGVPVDLEPAEFDRELRLVEQKRRDFRSIERRCREGGLVGDILGYCSFGGCQLARAMLEKSGFAPRVTGTLVGTGLEATLDTIFRMRQTFNDGEHAIPVATLGEAKGWQHVEKGLNDLKIASSPEAFKSFIRTVVGAVESTELSNFVLLAIGQHGEARLLKAVAAFFAAVFVVSPLYAATEFEPAEERPEDRFAGTKAAVLAVVSPNDPRVPHATRGSALSAGERALRGFDLAHKITQGVQAVIPNAIADTLLAGGEQVRDFLSRPVENRLRKQRPEVHSASLP